MILLEQILFLLFQHPFMSLSLFIFTLFSMAFILIPFTFAIIYWMKRGFLFDQKTNLIAIYIIVNVLIHTWVTYLAFNSTNNLFLFRIINLTDMFFLGLFLLSLFISSTYSRITIALLFGVHLNRNSLLP